MGDATAASYDEVPYTATAFHYTHPDRLATIGVLRGLEPAPVNRCRLLELGCASGANLLPMAESFPESHFVGLDLSPRQVADGRAIIAELGLGNIDIRTGDILEVDSRLGQFDYIVCHGVFSWVPAAVQDKILSICADNLAPNGVAYVSYNTYPGWHMRGLVRDLLYFQAGSYADPRQRLEQARDFLSFLVRAIPDSLRVYREIITEEAGHWTSQQDTYLLHEFLDDVNHPLYFHEFMGRAAAKGLQYLGEARPSTIAASLPRAVTETLTRRFTDPLEREQHLDFICGATFRRTLLCHAAQPLEPTPAAARLASLQASALAQPVAPEPDLLSDAVEEFTTLDNVSFSTNSPLVKTALVCLRRAWPRTLSLDALWSAVLATLPPGLRSESEKEVRASLADVLLSCFHSNLLELHRQSPQFTAQVSDRPVASPLARLQAREGLPVTSRRHRGVQLSEFDRVVLRHLDGSRDRAALLQALVGLVLAGDFDLQQGDQAVRDPGLIRTMFDAALDACLQKLALAALLIA